MRSHPAHGGYPTPTYTQAYLRGRLESIRLFGHAGAWTASVSEKTMEKAGMTEKAQSCGGHRHEDRGRTGPGPSALVAWVVALLSLLALAPAAQAHTITGLTPLQARYVERSYAPLPENVEVSQRACTNPELAYTSCAHLDLNTLDIHPRHARSAFVLRHEIGHLFNEQFMDAAEQERYAEIVGLEEFDIEWFANTYAECAGTNPNHKRKRHAQSDSFPGQITERQARRVCRLLTKWVTT